MARPKQPRHRRRVSWKLDDDIIREVKIRALQTRRTPDEIADAILRAGLKPKRVEEASNGQA